MWYLLTVYSNISKRKWLSKQAIMMFYKERKKGADIFKLCSHAGKMSAIFLNKQGNNRKDFDQECLTQKKARKRKHVCKDAMRHVLAHGLNFLAPMGRSLAPSSQIFLWHPFTLLSRICSVLATIHSIVKQVHPFTGWIHKEYTVHPFLTLLRLFSNIESEKSQLFT